MKTELEEDIMPVKVQVRVGAEVMIDFMLYHIYASAVGVITIILGILNIGLGIAFASRKEFLYMAGAFAFAVVVFVIYPQTIKNRVKRQMERMENKEALVTYTFSEDGVETVTKDDSGKADWSAFKKAVSRKRLLLLYDDKKQAVILPIDQIQEEYAQIVDMISAHMPAPAVRIKRLGAKQ